MKKKLVFSAILVCLLALGLMFVGCSSDSTSLGEYTLSWGIFVPGSQSIDDVVAAQGWNVTATDGGDAGYATGTTATKIYVFCLEEIDFDDGGAIDGEFADLVGYSNDGIGAPPELKAAMLSNKDKAPLAGIFKVNSPDVRYNSHIVYYIVKN
ncbi:MAG: hypothetical protein FWH35_03290 [Treponema sp.]|nr:hypothetical protein [Treponema sp.]